jgi:glutaminyl-peptide cyclotransferase
MGYTMGYKIMILALIPALLSCRGNRNSAHLSPPSMVKPSLVRTIPHDTAAFTQGLVFLNGRLYESTGLHGRSSLRVIDTAYGEIIGFRAVPGVFAEGLAFAFGRLYQLTWQEGIALVYDTAGLRPVDTLRYEGEGWGLTAGPDGLIMSNGSASLSFRTRRMDVVREVTVTRNGSPVTNLNELEYAKSRIYANVWFSDFIFEIEPMTGAVTRIVDCTDLVRLSGATGQEAVLNGIAYDQGRGTFYLTGKNWPVIFEVRLP